MSKNVKQTLKTKLVQKKKFVLQSAIDTIYFFLFLFSTRFVDVCNDWIFKGEICRSKISVWTSSICKHVLKHFYFLFSACLCLCLFLLVSLLPRSLVSSLSPSTYTNTNKHSCHAGLLLRASESLQMGIAKCRCHSASVPKKQGHLLWSQVTTGHLHTHTHMHKLTLKQTCSVQTHYECKQTYITVPQLQAQCDTALAPTQSGTYF